MIQNLGFTVKWYKVINVSNSDTDRSSAIVEFLTPDLALQAREALNRKHTSLAQIRTEGNMVMEVKPGRPREDVGEHSVFFTKLPNLQVGQEGVLQDLLNSYGIITKKVTIMPDTLFCGVAGSRAVVEVENA